MDVAHTGCWFASKIDAEVLKEKLPRPGEVPQPGSLVSLSAQSGIGEVVENPAKYVVTVGAVLGRVQQVRMPDTISQFGGHERDLMPQHAQLQKAAV